MAGVNETKHGNIVRPIKVNRLTGYTNRSRTIYNKGVYTQLENNMISAQDELDKAFIALNDAQTNYLRAELANTQLSSSGKSYDIREKVGNNTYTSMVKQSKQNLLNLGKIYTSAKNNFNNAENKFINAEKTFNTFKQKFNTFKQNFENSKKAPSSSWLPWRRGGRKTHKRKTNKRRHTKRNRN
jgi:hypothetical protein